MSARRVLLRVAVIVVLWLFPHITEKLIEHIGIGLLVAWLGWQHGHSPPRH